MIKLAIIIAILFAIATPTAVFAIIERVPTQQALRGEPLHWGIHITARMDRFPNDARIQRQGQRILTVLGQQDENLRTSQMIIVLDTALAIVSGTSEENIDRDQMRTWLQDKRFTRPFHFAEFLKQDPDERLTESK